MMTDATLVSSGYPVIDAALVKAAARWRADIARARDTKAELDRVIVAAAAAGMPETQIAAVAGCTRMTVRKALGK